MELVSTTESLEDRLKSFTDLMEEIGSWMSAWDRDPGIKAKIEAVDSGMTKCAYLKLIANAQAVGYAIYLIDHSESIDFSNLMAEGVGMHPLQWIHYLDDFERSDSSPIEHQCRVVLVELTALKEHIQEFRDDRLEPLVSSERFGPHARVAFQHYLSFHQEHMRNAFLMLQGLLVQGLDRRFAYLPVLVYRMEQMLSVVQSIVMTPSEELSHDHDDNVSLDISAWALPKQ